MQYIFKKTKDSLEIPSKLPKISNFLIVKKL